MLDDALLLPRSSLSAEATIVEGSLNLSSIPPCSGYGVGGALGIGNTELGLLVEGN